MNGLTLFGLFAVTAMLVTYALERRSPWFILAFAAYNAGGRRVQEWITAYGDPRDPAAARKNFAA